MIENLYSFDSLGLAPFALCHFASRQDDEEPEYGDLSYLAMLWCSGVGIGLIFYGASEPLMHAVDGTNRALGRICLHICLHVLWDRTGTVAVSTCLSGVDVIIVFVF